MMWFMPAVPLLLLALQQTATAFAPTCSHRHATRRVAFVALKAESDSSSASDDAEKVDDEGKDLAAEFFKLAQKRNIGLDDEDLLDDEDEDDGEEEEEEEVVAEIEDDEEEEEEEVNYPQGAINAFLGYDTGDVGEKLAGNVSLTDNQLYSEVRDRVLDTAGGFVDLLSGPDDDDDDSDEDDDDGKPKEYKPPTTVPDSDLTAGEVVLQVLDSLLHNDVPTTNRGVEILFGYSSTGSQITNEVGLTPAEYADFLKESEYKVLFDHQEVSIDKGDYSFDGKKAFFTARLRNGPKPLDFVSVNFILSTLGNEDDDCWLIDSMLIRPESMRRRRRR
jgi:hypothetical protein